MDQAAAGSYEVVKHKKGKPLNSIERRIILNVFNKCSEEYPSLSAKEKKLTSEFTRVSICRVFSVRENK
jgi:hypothetical protein